MKNKNVILLENALNLLERTDCSFGMCEGPNKPKDMITCTKCTAMIYISEVLENLKKNQGKFK